jgi:hypothetical protein
VTTRAEVAVTKAGLAIDALSGHLAAEARNHGWTDESRQSALRVLKEWRDDLVADGVVRPDHVLGWGRWLEDQGLTGTLTTDEKDSRVELIRDLDLYVARMHS